MLLLAALNNFYNTLVSLMIGQILKGVVFVSMFCMAVSAYGMSSGEFLDRINGIDELSLPVVDSVVPGYERPKGVVPSLLVGDFMSDGVDGYEWGGLVGYMLRWRLGYTAPVQLRMPDYNTFRTDTWYEGVAPGDQGRGMASLNTAAQRLGIKHILSGEMRVEAGQFYLNAYLTKAGTKAALNKYVHQGALDQLSDTLNEMASAVFVDLGVEPVPEIRTRIAPRLLTASHLKQAAWWMSRDNWATEQERKQALTQLWIQGERILPIAAAYMYHLPWGDDVTAYHLQLDRMRGIYSGDVGIRLASARYRRWSEDSPTQIQDKITRLKKLVSDHPNDPNMMIILGDELARASLTQEALVVCMEALKRWPDNYRVWWNMAYALNRHAWLVRGNSYWSEVSERGKRLFPQFKHLAREAMEVAVEMNPDNAKLHVTRMAIANGNNATMRESFRRAIDINPQHREAYEEAAKFTMRRWGGSYALQRKVFELAQENIQDPKWHNYIQRRYGEEPNFGEEFLFEIQNFFVEYYESLTAHLC